MNAGEMVSPHDTIGSSDHPQPDDVLGAAQGTGDVPGPVQSADDVLDPVQGTIQSTGDLLQRIIRAAGPTERPGARPPGPTSGAPIMWALGVLMGAAAMYLLDEDHGEQRRATVVRRMGQYRDEVEQTIDRAGEQALGRVRGTAQEALRRVRESMITDETIVRSIHARLEEVLPFEEAAHIRVEVRRGQVILEGTIAPDRLNRLLGRVATVPGVRGLDNRLVVRAPTS